MQLTAEQQAIVEADFEHCVITAVAGSGKTTTLAYRIRHLLERGHDPKRMLVLMFNRSARDDFARKLRRIIPDRGAPLPEIRTYHSMGYRLYQRFIKEGVLPPIKSELLEEGQIHYQLWQMILKLAPKSLQDDIKRNKKDHIEVAASFIDLVKSTLAGPECVFEEAGYTDKYRYLIELFDHFEQWRKQQQRITFADMLYEPVKAIHAEPALQALVTNKMDMMLVDEYQDTNEIQHLLLKYVAGDRARVTVVGDPDQTIYEFRGARPEFILNRFAEEFESPKELTLSYSFRYGHQVALLANHLISHNKGRKDVLCRAHPGNNNTRIHSHRHRNDTQAVIELLKQPSLAENYERVAILVRVWSQSVPIELALLQAGIPYYIESKRSALHTRELEAIMALLELACGQLAPLSTTERHHRFEQILRFPHAGLKEGLLQQLCHQMAQVGHGWWRIVSDFHWPDMKSFQARKLDKLALTLKQMEAFRGKAAQALRYYAKETDLFEGIRSLAFTHEIADERIGSIEGYIDYIHTLNLSIPETLTHIQHLKSLFQQQSQGTQAQGILLSTMHRTKGLEWPVVIIPGVTERTIPYTQRESGSQPIDHALLESERRLLYVAMTRAIQELHLIVPAPEASDRLPSRFYKEMAFTLSQALGDFMAQSDNTTTAQATEQQALPETPANTAPTFEFKGALTPIAKRYARQADIELKSQRLAPLSAQLTGKQIWHHSLVTHSIFGDGEVLGEDERSFEVRFEDGKTMNFSKKSAHLYFVTPTTH